MLTPPPPPLPAPPAGLETPLETRQADGFDLAGSYLLQALVRPSLNIDLALRIPDECLTARDSLNHRYLDKRALYVGHLVKEALDKSGRIGRLVDKAEVRLSTASLPIVHVQRVLSRAFRRNRDTEMSRLTSDAFFSVHVPPSRVLYGCWRALDCGGGMGRIDHSRGSNMRAAAPV